MNATEYVPPAEKSESVMGFTFRFLTSVKGLLYFTEPFIISQLSYLDINGIFG